MPSMKINGTPVEFTAGATILDAARKAGIDIPTLCWYPKLSTVANCRICLVSVDGQGKLTPACYTPAAEGMSVETESPAAKDNRKGVLESCWSGIRGIISRTAAGPSRETCSRSMWCGTTRIRRQCAPWGSVMATSARATG